MAVRRKKAAAKPPEPRPDFFTVGLWNVQIKNLFAREKLKASFHMNRRQRFQFHLHLEQEHQPVRLALIAVFADQPGQMQVRRREFQSGFLVRLAAGAGVRRLAEVHLQFAAARAPQAAIRLLRAFEQKSFLLLAEAVKQRCNFAR